MIFGLQSPGMFISFLNVSFANLLEIPFVSPFRVKGKKPGINLPERIQLCITEVSQLLIEVPSLPTWRTMRVHDTVSAQRHA
ncbi:hypothetical protein CEXT_396491 [Caerostris extrusa]|uniref:Uncharacterized protein n=1 Tax=Caerostris extrusa TaxID=172846 RepID=A0AAV4SEJ6_CAEEX|nr:hypothetical protein CEXT_396491 [Caerostris extrusa]